MLSALLDRERYATLGRDEVAVLCDLLAERGAIPTGPKGFEFLRIERFACGSPVEVAHWIAVYRHTLSGLEFSLIPAGSFLMGSPVDEPDHREDEPQRRVDITQPFLFARTHCTDDAWARGLAQAAERRDTGDNWSLRDQPYPHFGETNTSAGAWCRAGGLELPTEEQWEYGCRAGTETAFCFGGNLEKTDANFDNLYRYSGKTTVRVLASGPMVSLTPVARFRPNAFGLYDVHGLLMELTASQHSMPVIPQTSDSTEPLWIARGGGCSSPALSCRSAARYIHPPRRWAPVFGFRPCLTLPLTKADV